MRLIDADKLKTALHERFHEEDSNNMTMVLLGEVIKFCDEQPSEQGFHDGYLHGLEIAKFKVVYKRDKEKIQKVIDWTNAIQKRESKAGEQE